MFFTPKFFQAFLKFVELGDYTGLKYLVDAIHIYFCGELGRQFFVLLTLLLRELKREVGKVQPLGR